MEGKKNYAQRARVRALIERHTPREIADRLGISRQRIYQILADEAIDYLALQRQHRLRQTASRNLVKSFGPEAAAHAHTNLNIFASVVSILESGHIYGAGSAQKTAAKIIDLCKTEQVRQLTMYDNAVQMLSDKPSTQTDDQQS